jgi:hypothetical protein
VSFKPLRFYDAVRWCCAKPFFHRNTALIVFLLS